MLSIFTVHTGQGLSEILTTLTRVLFTTVEIEKSP